MNKFTNNMNEFNKKTSNGRKKFAGTINEFTGKLTGNEQLELKGKIQVAKANFNEKIDVNNNINTVKEKIAGKINDILDSDKEKNNK